jgi:hypothetical protein
MAARVTAPAAIPAKPAQEIRAAQPVAPEQPKASIENLPMFSTAYEDRPRQFGSIWFQKL